MWTIDNTKLSDFGVYVEKGSYSEMMSMPGMKTYLTEDVREIHGERVDVRMQRKQARSISIRCCMIAESTADFFLKHDSFVRFMTERSLFEFKLVKHNRIYMYYYEGCSDFSALKPFTGGKMVSEFTLNLREPNPDDIFSEVNLASETNDLIITESGKEIIVNKKI